MNVSFRHDFEDKEEELVNFNEILQSRQEAEH